MKRIYIKPESTLLEERYDTMLLAGSMGTNLTDPTGQNLPGGPVSGGGGNGGEGGSDINGEARGYSFFGDDDF